MRTRPGARWRLLTLVGVTSAAALVCIGTPAIASGAAASTTSSASAAAKNAVASGFRSQFRPALRTPIGFTGSVGDCRAGSTSALARARTLAALNYTRGLAHLDPVTFNTAMDDEAQQTALLMAANRALSHDPPSTWRCWSGVAARTAGQSNLLFRYPRINAGLIVQQYLNDSGSTNTAVGHRRWLLDPFTTQMGAGSTQTTNAIVVIGPTSRARRNPAYVPWPSAGWFPSQLEPRGRWSMSSGRGADLAHARVQVFDARGHRLPVRQYAVQNGYAEPTIAWQMPAHFNRTGTYRVRVTGIRHAAHSSHSYTVSLFHVS